MANVQEIGRIVMAGEMARVEAAAHNLGNVATAGYRRTLVADRPFSAALDGLNVVLQRTAGPKPETGAAAPLTMTDFSAGHLIETGNTHDLALLGPGFFAVADETGIAYTRAGALIRDERGHLVTPAGARLQGEGGDIVVGSEQWRVTADGTVLEDQRPVGRIAVFDFADRSALVRGPNGAFVAHGVEPERVSTTTIRQGALESSNVDQGHEMVQVMESMRRFQLGQRLVLAHQDMLDRAIRRLGDLQS